MTHDRFYPLDNAAVRLCGGLIHDRVHNNYLIRLSSEGYQVLKEPFLKNQHFTFYGEYGAKYFCAYAMAYRYSKDETVRRHMEDMKDTILANQKPDGYLGTESIEDDRWHNWNVWNYKYVLLGLLHYYDATGDDSVLPAIEKGAQLCANAFLAPDGPDIISTPWEGFTGASILEPMALLYRRTGNRLYLDFCYYILNRLEDHHHFISKLCNGARACDLEPRKAYELTTTVEGLLEVYRCNRDTRLLTAAKNYWQSLQDTQISITGSGSQFEVWQFSPDVRYQDGAGQNAMENCVTNYWIRLSRQLYWETGEEKYAHAFNRSVFNSLFAEQKPDGSDACYYQALSGTKRFGVDCPYPFHWAHCCHSSSTRTLSELPGFAFAQNGDVLDSVIFCDMEATVNLCGRQVRVKEESAYPAGGRVQYEFECDAPVEFTFRILIPQFCRRAAVYVNGDPIGANPGEFVLIRRIFRSADRISVEFDMPVRLVFGRGESEGRVAVQYGPLVLAVDERFNAGRENIELLVDPDHSLTLTPAKLPERDPVCVLFEADALVNGNPDKAVLVDFVHAGSYNQTPFQVWQHYRMKA